MFTHMGRSGHTTFVTTFQAFSGLNVALRIALVLIVR
jgi:hypothetical protein